jgi:hypothetical protein
MFMPVRLHWSRIKVRDPGQLIARILVGPVDLLVLKNDA